MPILPRVFVSIINTIKYYFVSADQTEVSNLTFINKNKTVKALLLFFMSAPQNLFEV